MDENRPLTDEETERLDQLLVQIKMSAVQTLQKYSTGAVLAPYANEIVPLIQFVGVMLYSAQSGQTLPPGEASTLLWSLFNSVFNMGRASVMPKPKVEIVQ